MTKYLIEAWDEVYTIVDDHLEYCGFTEDISEDFFEEYGFDSLDSVSTCEDLAGADEYKVLRWSSTPAEKKKMTAILSGTPSAQDVITDRIPIRDGHVTGVESVQVDVSGSPRVSFDFGDGYEIYDTSTGTWRPDAITSNVSGGSAMFISRLNMPIRELTIEGNCEQYTGSFNQFAKEINGTNYRAYNTSNVTAAFLDGVAECTVQNASVSGYQVGVRATDNIPIVNGHIYFAFCEINSQKNTSFRVNLNSGSNNFNGGARLTVNTFVKCSVIITASRDYTQFIVSPNEAFSVGQKYSVKNIMLIDLTTIFGEGNEPATASEFELWCVKRNILLSTYQEYTTGVNIPSPKYRAPVKELHFTGAVVTSGSNSSEIGYPSVEGILSVGDAHDEYDAIGGVLTKRVESKLIGSMSWQKTTAFGQTIFYSTSTRGMTSGTKASMCSRYKYKYMEEAQASDFENEDAFYWFDEQGNMFVLDKSVTDVSAFVLAARIDFVYYELNEPETIQYGRNVLLGYNGVNMFRLNTYDAPVNEATMTYVYDLMNISSLPQIPEGVWTAKLQGKESMRTRFTLAESSDIMKMIKFKFLNEEV